MRKLFSLMACAAIVGLGFTSCDNDDDFIPNAIGDVYIKTIKDGDVIKHGLVYYAYANDVILTAKVGTPVEGADSVELTSFAGSKSTFRKYPERSVAEDFSTELPTAGTYGFLVTTEDEVKLRRNDELDDTTLPVADLSTSTFADNEIHVKFPRIENADAYIVRFEDAEGNRIFNSDQLANLEEPAEKDFIVANTSKGWLSEKSITDVKKIQLIAIKFESSEYQSPYEVSCISEAEFTKPE